MSSWMQPLLAEWLSLGSWLLPTLAVSVLAIVCILGWASNLFGLPGNWLILVAALLFDYFMPPKSQWNIGTTLLIILFVLALLGELLELLTSVLGVTRKGGSQRGAWGALAGSLIGGVVGAMVGIPIPIVGPMISLILFAGLGAMAGTVWAEYTTGRALSHSMEIGWAAMAGRVAGTVAKTIVGLLMLVVVVAGLLI